MATNIGGQQLGDIVLGGSARSGNSRSVASSLSFTQTIAHTIVVSRLVVSGIEWTHSRIHNGTINRAVASVLSFNETTNDDKCVVVTSPLTLAQTISYTTNKSIRQSLEWQQSFNSQFNFERQVHTVTGLSQRIVQNGRYNKTVSHTLSFGETISQARVQGVTHSLGLTQTIVGIASKGVSNALAFNQTIGVQLVSNRTISQGLGLESTIFANQAIAKEIHHGFGMNSFVGKQRVNTRTISNVFTPTQQVRFNVYSRTITSSFGLTQSVSAVHPIPQVVTSSLQFNETVGLNQVIVESVVSTLAFLPVRTVYVGLGNIENYNVENVQWSLIPAYMVGKKNNPHCVLQVKNDVITLPTPEFGDQENYGGVFTIRRSMNNIPYTHVRTLSLRKLNLPFVLAKRKAWELREFLIAHNPELMTLTTWKGDKWFVNLTTNPLELRVSGRYDLEDEKVSVDLEFEGLKVM